MNITKSQLETLESCTTAQQWREACDAIKAASKSKVSHPDDWWEKVVESGLMDRVASRWGGSSSLSVATFSNLKKNGLSLGDWFMGRGLDK